MSERILVVEDDPALAKNLILTLLRCGFKAESVSDGKSAIEKIATGLKYSNIYSVQGMMPFAGRV